MARLDRIRRVTDLFVEGTALNLGEDETGTPVVVWVNKLNSFELEEARRDGLAARAERIIELKEPGSRERKVLEVWSTEKTRDELIEATASKKFDEDYLGAMNDVEAMDEWKDRLLFLRRMGQLHDDAGINDDDERRKRYNDLNAQYMTAIREAAAKRQEDRKQELSELNEADLREKYIEDSIDQSAMTDYMATMRTTQLFYCLRDCHGVQDDDGNWDHSKCDHLEQMLSERREVNLLPEEVLAKVSDTLTALTVDQRTSGNLDAPTSSSESSEQQSSPEESTPSIPVVTPPVAAAT